MKFEEIPPEDTPKHISYIAERWGQLSKLELDWSSDAIKYLLFINSGASAAVLAFIGTVPAMQQVIWPKAMLGLFVFGIIMVGLVQATRFHRVEWLFKNWRTDTAKFYGNMLDWEDLLINDDKRSYSFNLAYVWAYASFLSFIAGVIVGVCNFYKIY